MTYGHAWEYGQTHVECEDFDTGERVSVEIPRGIYRNYLFNLGSDICRYVPPRVRKVNDCWLRHKTVHGCVATITLTCTSSCLFAHPECNPDHPTHPFPVLLLTG